MAPETTKKKACVLFKGTGSPDRVLEKKGYDVVSVDWLPKFNPTIVVDIMNLDYRSLWKPGEFDIVWASPDCTQYSKAKTRGERDLAGANALVRRTIEIIDYLQPRLWYFENPHTGLLKQQAVVSGIPYHVAHYCQYYDDRRCDFMPYKKETAFWSNAVMPFLRRCGGAGVCPMMCGRKHVGSCGNGHSKYNAVGCSSQEQKYMIPSSLLEALLAADGTYLTPSQFKRRCGKRSSRPSESVEHEWEDPWEERAAKRRIIEEYLQECFTPLK